MSAPAISLVTPTRGRADLLRRCIQMVRRQSLPDWELLVVDDGDGEGIRVATEMTEPRVRAMPNPGAGQVAARNAGIEAARGDLIHLLDDDDRWLHPDHLERVVAALAGQRALGYRAGWLVLEEKTENGWREHQRLSFDPPTSADSLRRDNTLLTSGVAYPRRLHDELGLFDSLMGNYWDWDWWLRVTAQHPLVRLGEPTVLMSWRGSNTSSDPHAASRVEFLRRLCAKHDLGTIPSKNHFTVLEVSRA